MLPANPYGFPACNLYNAHVRAVFKILIQPLAPINDSVTSISKTHCIIYLLLKNQLGEAMLVWYLMRGVLTLKYIYPTAPEYSCSIVRPIEQIY